MCDCFTELGFLFLYDSRNAIGQLGYRLRERGVCVRGCGRECRADWFEHQLHEGFFGFGRITARPDPDRLRQTGFEDIVCSASFAVFGIAFVFPFVLTWSAGLPDREEFSVPNILRPPLPAAGEDAEIASVLLPLFADIADPFWYVDLKDHLGGLVVRRLGEAVAGPVELLAALRKLVGPKESRLPRIVSANYADDIIECSADPIWPDAANISHKHAHQFRSVVSHFAIPK